MTTATMAVPMTTDEIDAANAEDEATVTRLTAELRELEVQQRAAVATQSAAIASGQGGDLGEMRRRIGERSDDMEGHRAAIESVKSRIASRATQRKTAVVREATAKADELAAQASEAVSALSSAFYALLNEIEPLYATARRAINSANSADFQAKSLAGRQPTVQTPRVSFPSGLEPIVDDLFRAVRNHNGSIQMSANAAGLSVDRSTNLHSVR